MQILCLAWAFVVLAELIIAGPTDPPLWIVPDPAVTSLTITSSQCSDITRLSASSGDGSTVLYSLVSQNPDGGFAVGADDFGDEILTCTQGSITTSPYEVVLRAMHQGGNNMQTDRTITITFSDQVPAVTGPTWSSGDSFSLDKSDCTCCDSAATLSADSSDSTSVTYSLESQNPDGGFSLSGNTLSCTYASIATPSHAVVVRAQNTGDGEHTDQTITFTVTEVSGEGPTWLTLLTDTSHTVNKLDNTDCSPAVSLFALSSDCSSVAYSIVSESPSGGFNVTGSNLYCTPASLNESFYTVVLSAANTGNSASTNLTLTINVTSGAGTDRFSSIGVVVTVCVSVSIHVGAGFPSYKACPTKKKLHFKNDPETTEQHNCDVRTVSQFNCRNTDDVEQEEYNR